MHTHHRHIQEQQLFFTYAKKGKHVRNSVIQYVSKNRRFMQKICVDNVVWWNQSDSAGSGFISLEIHMLSLSLTNISAVLCIPPMMPTIH